jgi:hypothetical protein
MGLFAGRGLARRSAFRVARLASLVAAHPHGPVRVEAAPPHAARRAEALRRALAEVESVDPTCGCPPASWTRALESGGARLVFLGYAATAPEPVEHAARD